MEIILRNELYTIEELEKIFGKKANSKRLVKIKEIKQLDNKNIISREINKLYKELINNEFGAKWDIDYKIVVILFGFKNKCNTITFTSGKPVICQSDSKLNSSRCEVHHKENIGRVKSDPSLKNNQNALSTGTIITKNLGKTLNKRALDRNKGIKTPLSINSVINDGNIAKELVLELVIFNKQLLEKALIELEELENEYQELLDLGYDEYEVRVEGYSDSEKEKEAEDKRKLKLLKAKKRQVEDKEKDISYKTQKYEQCLMNFKHITNQLTRELEIEAKVKDMNKDNGQSIVFTGMTSSDNEVIKLESAFKTTNDYDRQQSELKEKFKEMYGEGNE